MKNPQKYTIIIDQNLKLSVKNYTLFLEMITKISIIKIFNFNRYSQNYLTEHKGIRYPGKVEIITKSNNQGNEKKVVDVINNFEKISDKKGAKLSL